MDWSRFQQLLLEVSDSPYLQNGAKFAAVVIFAVCGLNSEPGPGTENHFHRRSNVTGNKRCYTGESRRVTALTNDMMDGEISI